MANFITLLKEAFNEYCIREYNCGCDEDINEKSIICIACTNYGDDEEYEVRVSYDVRDEILSTDILDENLHGIESISEPMSTEEIINAFRWWDFNDFVRDGHDWLYDNRGVDNY